MMGESLATVAKKFSNLLELIKHARDAAIAADLHRRFITADKRGFTRLQRQAVLIFGDDRFALDAEQDRRAILGDG